MSEFSMIKLLMQLIVSASLVVAGSAFAGGFVVDTRAGKIQGVEEKGVHSFKGIPYAMAPVGDLRWQAPLPIDKPMKLVAATEFGPACPQSALPGMPVVNMSEDCLLLNVWTPQPDSKKRPVMVWIHGGGFRAGSGNIPGETFANQGVVLVSLNYRLGPLGFFSHQALPGQPANAGVLDMIAALHWVQNNIQNFGGDPDNVTIFGISAGGMAVNLLLANDSVKGLVHGAIAQSGYSAWALPRSKKAPNPAPKDVYMGTAEQAEIIARELVARVSNQPQTKAMLYQLDGLALVKAQKGFQVPIVDGESVMEEPGIRFMQGNQLDVPYMTGGNSYEGSVMRLAGISAENYRRSIGENLDHARRLYSKDSDDIWLSRMFGDNRYLLSARLLAANMSQVPSKSWLYYTDFVTAEEKDNIPGTTHGRDGYFIFAGHLDSNKSIQTLSSRMQRYWVNFARTGNPNGDGLLHWPTYDRASDRWMVFSENDTVQTDVISSKLDLLESMYKKRVTLHEQ
ncbi:MAG: carboxylesterase family protein [Oceanicoccus sp.]